METGTIIIFLTLLLVLLMVGGFLSLFHLATRLTVFLMNRVEAKYTRQRAARRFNDYWQ